MHARGLSGPFVYRRNKQRGYAFCRIFSKHTRTRPGHRLSWPLPREGQTRREAGAQSQRAAPKGEAARLPKEQIMRDIGKSGDDNWLRVVVQNSSESVEVIGPDGTFRYASPAFGRIMGYEPGEASGKNLFDLVHPDDVPRVLEETERVASGGVPDGNNVVEYRFRRQDGSWRWVGGRAADRAG